VARRRGVHRPTRDVARGRARVLLVVRIVLFRSYRRQLGNALHRHAAAALDRAGRILLWAGTLVPLALLAASRCFPAPVAGGRRRPPRRRRGRVVQATLVLRAGHNQGFALPHMPVRGVAS